MQSACLQLQDYLAVILTDITLLDDFDKFNGKNRDSVPKLFYDKIRYKNRNKLEISYL